MILKKHFEQNKHRHVHHTSTQCGITINHNEVEYSVLNSLWKYKQMIGVQGESQLDYELTQQEQDWLDRQMQNAIQNAKDAMQPYVVNDQGRFVSDEIGHMDEYIILINTERGWLSNANIILNDVHNYCVNHVLYDWWSNSGNTERSNFYYELSDKWLRKIHSDMNEYDVEPQLLEW